LQPVGNEFVVAVARARVCISWVLSYITWAINRLY
jgi:hypothetical protein